MPIIPKPLLLALTCSLAFNLFAKPTVLPGDRIAIVGNTYADQLRIHGYLETFLLQRTQGEPVSIRNLGWGGDILTVRERPTNFPSETSSLTEHKTDLIIACFGMGESFDGPEGLAEFEKSLKAFISSHKGKKYNGQSEVRLAMISPIAQEDLGVSTPKSVQRNRNLKSYVESMQAVCLKEGVSFVDLYEPTIYLMEDENAPKITENGIRLNEYGYWATSRTLADSLIAPTPSWWINLNVKSGKAEARGVSVEKVRADGKEIGFQVYEKSAPSLPPPVSGTIHPSLQSPRDRMLVEGLAPGKYLLQVDGQDVVSGSHEQWANGLPIDQSPAHKEAEAFRIKVNDKNLQFTYSWKALNQVHIVGERKKSPAGAALPEEVIRFNELAILKDAELRKAHPPKTREWKLIRQ
jgi:hypothetical protein